MNSGRPRADRRDRGMRFPVSAPPSSTTRPGRACERPFPNPLTEAGRQALSSPSRANLSTAGSSETCPRVLRGRAGMGEALEEIGFTPLQEAIPAPAIATLQAPMGQLVPVGRPVFLRPSSAPLTRSLKLPFSYREVSGARWLRHRKAGTSDFPDSWEICASCSRTGTRTTLMRWRRAFASRLTGWNVGLPVIERSPAWPAAPPTHPVEACRAASRAVSRP